MIATNLTELALRAGVNTTKRESTSDGNYTQNIKKASLKRAQELLAGNSTVSNLASQIDWQSMAINLAIQGIEFSYMTVKAQIESLKYKRLSFDKERQAGIATFIIPTNKEERDLSKEEFSIKAFINLANKQHSFINYLGIDTNVLSEMKDVLFYSVLPFYRMSEALGQPISSSSSTDKQRTAINLFFKSAFPEAISDINNEFQTENKFIEFWKSAFKKENYLNDFRAHRFIMMCLANLLWNLQHPVDPATGFPLSINATITLCSEVESFLNKLLNSQGNINLKELYNHYQLLSFINKIEIHTKSLKAAYVEEQLYELNFSDLLNNAHQTLRIMDTSIFELIYTRKNPITQSEEPNRNAAEELAYTISYLNQLLIYNPDLISPFRNHCKHLQKNPFANKPPTTIIDVLISYVHSSNHEKGLILHELQKNKNDSAIEFTNSLKIFNKKFIRPVRKISQKDLQSSLLHKKSKEVAFLTARRLIPLLTLVIEDYGINVDLPHSDTGVASQKIYSGKDQVMEVNRAAMAGSEYYVWELSPFIELEKDTEDELDNLPKYQYRFTQITQLLDLVNEIVQNYRSFLQVSVFQQFLIKCLNKVKKEYSALEGHITQIDKYLSKDKSVGRNMQAILQPMTHNLAGSIEAFSVATYNFNRVISAPDFSEKQKKLLASKIDSIHQKFANLFNEDSGIASLIAKDSLLEKEGTRVKDTPKPIIPQHIDTSKVIALRKLVVQTFEALSYQSKNTEKGFLLNNLLNLIDTKPNFTEATLKNTIRELARITLSYRSTFFFQAQYGETRSAKVLIEAIKNPELNLTLPLNSTLFAQKERLIHKFSDEEIIHKLRQLRKTNDWQEAANQIKALDTLMC